MSDDTEIEDVSFLPGESLHRKALYEPNIIQRCRRWACSQGRTTVIGIMIGLTLCVLIIILIATLAKPGCGSGLTTSTDQSHTKDYISTNGKEFPYKDIRLPASVLPVNYVIFMHPNLTQERFEGHVSISCKVVKDTDFIVFHSKDLTISKLSVSDTKTGDDIVVTEYLEYKDNEQIYVQLGSTLTSGSEVTVDVTFQGQLINKLAGFYRSMYKTNSGEKRYIATTHFEPTDARAAFPCFDEPQLKATFELTMVRDPSYKSLSNMPLLSNSTYKEVLFQDKFQRSLKMSTYLVAFVVCDYASLTKSTSRNITVSVYAPKDAIESARFALDSAVTVLNYYETYFGVEYPLPKQDMIAIPDFAAGAMENWGLITYRMTAILYNPGVSSAYNQQRVAVVVAHELAHQWFGNLVTMDWWDDLWLNEGFASYVEYIGSSVVQPDWHMKEQFVKDASLSALYLDCLSNSHPIMLPVHNPDEINEIFDSISYSKGASIIRMLDNYLGEDVFKKGLTSYLKKYKFSNAATKDLWESLSSSSSVDVSALMDTWTSQMGYPVITLHQTGSKVTATQSRFLLYENSNSTPEFTSNYGYKWKVPFSYTTSLAPSNVNKLLMSDTTATFAIQHGTSWIKGNSGMYGYYRVNYDDDNWQALISQLKQDHTVFSASERAGMIDDIFMLARAGLVEQHLALDLTLYMATEDDYLPWSTLLSNLAYIEARIDSKPVYTNYKKYLMKLMKRQLDKTTWEDTGTHQQKYLRSAILGKAINLEHGPSIDKGRQLFEQWKLNHTSISPNLKSVIYLAGIKFGTEADWEHMWDAYLIETVASEQQKLLSSLGLTRDVRLLGRLLNYGLIESIVRSQDTSRVVSVVSSSPGGQILAWRFFQQNWQIFHSRYGTMAFILSRLIKTVASNFDTKFDLDEVQEFFSGRDVASAKRAVQQVHEKIQMNIDWLSAHESDVTQWFMQHGT